MSSLFTDAPVPIAAQIKCVEREIAMRLRVYKRRVDNGQMKQEEADQELRTMRAVLATLRDVEAKR